VPAGSTAPRRDRRPARSTPGLVIDPRARRQPRGNSFVELLPCRIASISGIDFADAAVPFAMAASSTPRSRAGRRVFKPAR